MAFIEILMLTVCISYFCWLFLLISLCNQKASNDADDDQEDQDIQSSASLCSHEFSVLKIPLTVNYFNCFI